MMMMDEQFDDGRERSILSGVDRFARQRRHWGDLEMIFI